MNTAIKAEWAGIKVTTDHRFVVRHAYGEHLVVTNLERFQSFVGIHGAAQIMQNVSGHVNRALSHPNEFIKDWLPHANDTAALFMSDGIRVCMPYASTIVKIEADDWMSVLTAVDGIKSHVCTISHQMDGDDNRVHIDFYCEEQ